MPRIPCLLVLVLLLTQACGAEPAREHDASVASRLCDRVAQCDLLPADSNAAECGAVLDDCTQDLDTSARDAWQRSLTRCLDQASCATFERCYLDAPGC